MQQSRTQLKVERLKLSDLDSIMEIEPKAYGSHHWSRQSFLAELTNPSGNYLGAFSTYNDKLLGYTGYWLVGDEAHITTLAVHPEHRREHIGESLLVHNVLDARENSALWLTLEVRVSNEAAQKLYFKYGFRNLGIRKRYYQDNSEDALVLWTDRITDSSFIDQFAICASKLGHDLEEIKSLLAPEKRILKEDKLALSKLASA